MLCVSGAIKRVARGTKTKPPHVFTLLRWPDASYWLLFFLMEQRAVYFLVLPSLTKGVVTGVHDGNNVNTRYKKKEKKKAGYASVCVI